MFNLRQSGLALVAIAAFLGGCESNLAGSSVDSSSSTVANAKAERGRLEFRANGEDFVRQGFTSSDGWAIQFEHVYVTLADLTASVLEPDGLSSEDNPTTSPLQQSSPQEAVVTVDGAQTVDLAAGDESADTILIQSLDAPATHFKGLTWNLVPALTGPAQGEVIQLVGQAEKNGQTVDFVLSWDQPYAYACGEFVGDERKGLVKSGVTSDVEATFHFDHIFGDGEAPADDKINQGAVGFSPFAALVSEGGMVEADREALEAQLSAQDYETLQTTFASLGHVGEGHCDARAIEL